MTSSEKPEPQGSEPSSTDLPNAPCRCGHPRRRHVEPPGAQCLACSGDEERSWRHEFAPEPPLTPEEEEGAPEDKHDWGHATPSAGPTCTRCGLAHKNWNGSECPAMLPPQPERRAPYVATYSVGGHLYEVAVPGDASLQAVDGALVIRHGLGPVAGLVGFQPLTVEEKA
jgi:hypothetical protein